MNLAFLELQSYIATPQRTMDLACALAPLIHDILASFDDYLTLEAVAMKLSVELEAIHPRMGGDWIQGLCWMKAWERLWFIKSSPGL